MDIMFQKPITEDRELLSKIASAIDDMTFKDSSIYMPALKERLGIPYCYMCHATTDGLCLTDIPSYICEECRFKLTDKK